MTVLSKIESAFNLKNLLIKVGNKISKNASRSISSVGNEISFVLKVFDSIRPIFLKSLQSESTLQSVTTATIYTYILSMVG